MAFDMDYGEGGKISRADLSESRTPESVISSVEGKVSVFDEEVRIEPPFGTPLMIKRVRDKIHNQEVFDGIASTVSEYKPCPIIEDKSRPDKGIYYMQRAKGVPLAFDRFESEKREEFLRTSCVDKFAHMMTYLKVICSLNEEGYCFNDHKSNSIFLSSGERYGKTQKTISVVDAPGMLKVGESYGAIRKFREKHVWEHEKKGNIGGVLKSFFTGPFTENEKMIPSGVLEKIDNIDRYKNSAALFSDLRKYLSSNEKFTKLEAKKKKNEMLRDEGLIESEFEWIRKNDFSNMSKTEIEILEANIARKKYLRKTRESESAKGEAKR